MKQKICTGCSEIKDITEFHRSKHSSDGRASHCKMCLKAYYQANKKQVCAISRKYYKEQGKALRKLPKKEKQFSVDEGTYQKEHEKFFNEEFVFVLRKKAKEKYDPAKASVYRRKYYVAHQTEMNDKNRRFYYRNRDVILEKGRLKREGMTTHERAVFNKNHRETQSLKRKNMSDEEWETASAEWRERYRLKKAPVEVRPYRRYGRRKIL